MLTVVPMTLAHLRTLDLNSLVALDGLLSTGSVTLAARQLGLTQSAMSRTLARLRVWLDDPLLVRTGRQMLLTPRAQRLGVPLREALLRLEEVVVARPRFTPETAERAFSLATADYGFAVLLPGLLAHLRRVAPNVSVVSSQLGPDWVNELASGALDAVVCPKRDSSPGVVWTRLLTERMVCAVSANSPVSTLSLKRFCELPHVFVAPVGQSVGVVDEALARLKLKRQVALRMPSFLAAALVVGETDLVVTLAERVARLFSHSLKVVASPIALPDFTVSLAWHERTRDDPGHAWFRQVVRDVAKAMD